MAAWSQAGWLAYVELSDRRDRERNLKEEREALRSYVAEALAEQAELDRQAQSSGDEAGSLAAASTAAGFRARILEVQLAALDAASRRLVQPALSLDLIGRDPIQLLRSIAEPGAMIRLLKGLSTLSSSPEARPGPQALEHRRVALTVARNRLQADRSQLIDAGSGLATRRLAAEEAAAGRLAESRRLGGSIVQTEESIAALEARIDQAVQETWAAAAQIQDPEFAALSAGHSSRFRFVWPESNAWISQGFGPSALAGEPAFRGFAHFHQGVDLAAPANSVVAAADDGVVIMTQTGNYGYGNFVMLAHPGGVVTLYGHLNRILVQTGEQVIQGRPIGLEGSTGYSTGPHLHFEVRVDGEPVDPMPFLPYGGPSGYRL